MNNLVMIPIIVPVIAGMIMVVFRKNVLFHRILGLASIISVFVASLVIVRQVQKTGIQTLQLGGWDAPFGVSMVADMFSILLILTTSVVSFCCFLYAFQTIGKERETHYFYPLFLFLIAGVNGSFLTGDIFNLFVCFEVMLVSSYALISLGGVKRQLRASIIYVLTNVLSSSLFLVAIAFLYRMTGTLNLAHLSVRVAEAGQGGLMTTVAFLFLIVFSLKAGLFLFFWLPSSYSAPPTAISAIFAALLTKVGIYAIIRMFTLIFYHEPEVTHYFIGILAALTMALGAIGAVAYNDINRILVYNVIVGVGFILAGVASYSVEGLTGSLYYLLHDMVVKALIFLLGGTVLYITGKNKLKEMSGLIQQYPFLGWMFFIAALSIAGIPPLSGFLGKIFITEGTFAAQYFWLGGIGLFTSLMVLYSVMKIFMNVFWGPDLTDEDDLDRARKGILSPIAVLTFITIALGLGAEGISDYVDIAIDGLMDANLYIEAVLGPNATQ